MSGEFFDNLFTGRVSRRAFLEKVSTAAVALPLMGTPVAEALAQQGSVSGRW